MSHLRLYYTYSRRLEQITSQGNSSSRLFIAITSPLWKNHLVEGYWLEKIFYKIQSWSSSPNWYFLNIVLHIFTKKQKALIWWFFFSRADPNNSFETNDFLLTLELKKKAQENNMKLRNSNSRIVWNYFLPGLSSRTIARRTPCFQPTFCGHSQ